MQNNLYIRVDANTQIGTGHVMRCIALAQVWKKQGGQVTFISSCGSESLRNRINDEEFQLVTTENLNPGYSDLKTTLLTVQNSTSNNAWVVLDGYHFDTDYHQSIKNNGNQLLVIDDTAHLDHYIADIILNQNVNAKELSYSCEPNTKLLLGTEYVLLRNEFLANKNWKRKIPKVANKILLTMGGADQDNVTFKVLKAINQINIGNLEIKVVIGPSNLHLDTLLKVAEDSKHNVELLQSVSHISYLMAWADMAISAAGSTCWELSYFGLPAILIITSENQIMNLDFLVQYGAVTTVSNRMNISTNMISQKIHQLIMNKELRKKMSHTGKLLVDGIGRERVVKTLQTIKIKLRENITV